MSEIKYYPSKSCGGIVGWNWIDSDTGAWDGPCTDWENHHAPSIIKYVKNYRVAIQAGGNQGMYPRLLSRLFQHVYTFEPDPLNFKTLVLNIDQDNITPFQAALGSHSGMCTINRVSMTNVGMHTINEVSEPKVPILGLDSVLHLKHCDLIMLDLEGYELNALKGMLRIIEMHKPVIFVERPSADVHTLLANFGYIYAGPSSMDGVFVVA